jgi:FKBP-type peptidyl-prolyl cis-trans isomerase
MIADFIEENNLEGEFMADGIFVSIENPGNGDHPNENDSVETFYEGKYVSDSKVFDGSLNKTITFSLNQVISGWKKGIPYFGVGEKGWLVLPANEAYGSFPPQGVRANAPMAFYIELVSIK